ncbi:MAG TPA: hypothetical protein VFA97_00680 [Gaiellaceae bacterium]|nr:hypothetical protein [Gaiellaceae bacterium]
MATGIVSVACAELGLHVLSWTFAALAFALYATVGVAAVVHRSLGPTGAGAFAAVAATAVLGSRLAIAGVGDAAWAFLAAAFVVWLCVWAALLPTLELGPPTGTRLLTTVATESLAILAAATTRSLAPFAVAAFVLGVLLYPWTLAQLPRSELRTGGGDVWIAMGALAISTLAAALLARQLGGDALRDVAFALWAAATAWLPVLGFAELRRPWLGFHPTRWSTVFPLGMYAAASAEVARLGLSGALTDDARVFLAVAIGAWLLTSAGLCASHSGRADTSA